MMVVLFSGPLALLSFYLACLCYRRNHYRHTLVLALIAGCMLVLTVSILAAGYLVDDIIRKEVAARAESVDSSEQPGERSGSFDSGPGEVGAERKRDA